MSLSKKDLIIFFLISLLFYFHFKKKENFSDIGLTRDSNGRIVVPGELLIEGNLKVNGNVGIRRDPHPRIGLVVNSTGLAVGLETMRGGVYVDGEIRGKKITKLR